MGDSPPLCPLAASFHLQLLQWWFASVPLHPALLKLLDTIKKNANVKLHSETVRCHLWGPAAVVFIQGCWHAAFSCVPHRGRCCPATLPGHIEVARHGGAHGPWCLLACCGQRSYAAVRTQGARWGPGVLELCVPRALPTCLLLQLPSRLFLGLAACCRGGQVEWSSLISFPTSRSAVQCTVTHRCRCLALGRAPTSQFAFFRA